MRFIAGLIEAVKILCFIQDLEFFLHLGKPVNTSVSVTQDLFSSDEVVKPDCFEDIFINRSQEIGLFVLFALWWNKRCFQRFTFSKCRYQERQLRISVLVQWYHETCQRTRRFEARMSGLYQAGEREIAHNTPTL